MRYTKNLVTAIVISGLPGEQATGKKYRNIKNAEFQIEQLITFAKKDPNASHINIYSKDTKQFLRQIRLK